MSRAYIALTALFSVAILPGAVLDIAQPDFVVDAMATIDMPLYVITLIGVWKLLGIVALALPRFRRINEWAYAGFFFDLTGAAFAHAAAGDVPSSVITPLVFLPLLGASYFLRDKRAAAARLPVRGGVGSASAA